MAARIVAGDTVRTPFGQGRVREVRNNGHILVDVRGRALVLKDIDIAVIDSNPKPRAASRVERNRRAPQQAEPDAGGGDAREVDLHGLTVEAALARAVQALDEALLADVAELRLIHGRSSGRIRAALHRRLREIPSVRGFQLDPKNEGVTLIRL